MGPPAGSVCREAPCLRESRDCRSLSSGDPERGGVFRQVDGAPGQGHIREILPTDGCCSGPGRKSDEDQAGDHVGKGQGAGYKASRTRKFPSHCIFKTVGS